MSTAVHHRVAFTYPNYVRFFWSRVAIRATEHMSAVALGQYVFERTHAPLQLGYLGLAVFLPRLIFALPAGHWADAYPRRLVIWCARWASALVALVLVWALLHTQIPLAVIYLLMALTSFCYVLDSSAASAFTPDLVVREHFPNAVTWNSISVQLAAISGPLLGGIGYSLLHGAVGVLLGVVLLRFGSGWLVRGIRLSSNHTQGSGKTPMTVQTLLAGVRYVFATPIILGTISLDLFAVLSGGAVALLPVYANDILHVGPMGLGILRAAPAVGAAAMAFWLTRRPITHRAGQTLLIAVAIFGIATIGFGLSRVLPLSLLCLAILGAADLIGVVIRGVMVQLCTPSAMRGRVSAVNLVFIGASNDLGEFESGITAHWFGVVPATVLGGGLTLLVVALWTRLFPQIRTYSQGDVPLH